MSIRKTVFLISFFLIALPLLFFTIYEYNMVNERILLTRSRALAEFATTQGETILQVASLMQTQSSSFTREIGQEDYTDDDLKDPLIIERINGILQGAVHEMAYTLDGSSRVMDYILLDGEGYVRASYQKDIIGNKLKGSPLYEVLTDTNPMSSFCESPFRAGEYGIWVTRRLSLNSDMLLSAFITTKVFAGQLNRMRLEQTGFGMILFDGDRVLSHPDSAYINTLIDNEEISSLYGEAMAGQVNMTGKGRTELFGVNSLYGYCVVKELGINVLVIQSVDEALITNMSFLWEAAIAGIVFAMVGIAIMMPLIQRKLIVPIIHLRESMLNATTGAYEPCLVKVGNEVGDLVNGFNRMVDQINASIMSLQHANDALRNAEENLQCDKERLKVSELRFQVATELSTIAVFELMSFTDEFFASDSWESITTYPGMDVFPREYAIRYIVHPTERPAVLKWSNNMETRFDEDLRILTSAGDYKWIHLSMAQITDEVTQVKKILGTVTDIHERVLAQERATYAAYHETLTGLPRRILFTQEVDVNLQRLRTNFWGVVFILSMDNFKRINDIFGFSVGDQAICSVAAMMQDRFEGMLYIARNSGNSFLMYAECPRNISNILELTRNILQVFKVPFAVGDLTVDIRVHLGAALYPDHGQDCSELIRNADIAMHDARYEQRQEFAIFAPSMQAKLERTHQIMEVLRELSAGRTPLVQYQPIVRASDLELLGFEVLVRIKESPIGMISPAEFIPLAEESRLIIPIGAAIMREACRKTKELIDAGHELHHMSVNVSTIQLEDPLFLDMVFDALNEVGLPYQKLQIEVTESLMISDLEISGRKLTQLRKNGIRIALDDFGTGYSSMKYLRTIPLDVIKIDKHFIDEIDLGYQNVFAVTMIQMAHDLNLEVVAEGVETEKQFRLLRDNKCDAIQGYFISRPLDFQDIDEFLVKLRKKKEELL